jgi:hypothetical protein
MKKVGEEGDTYTYSVIIDIASTLLCVATLSAVPEAMEYRYLTSVSVNSYVHHKSE